MLPRLDSTSGDVEENKETTFARALGSIVK